MTVQPELVPASTARHKLAWWMVLLVGILAAACYFNTLKNDFAFDDTAVVQKNVQVLNLDWSSIWASNYWPKVDGANPDVLYRPLTIWSYLANQVFTPTQPWGFHLVNVVLHALVAMLVCVFAWRVLGNQLVAFITGVLFAVHPLHTEAVANIVGRAELLAALWSLLALLVYLPARPLPEETGPERRGFWHSIVVTLCLFAASLSKETPLTMPGAIVLIDAWRWCQWPRESRPSYFRWFFSQCVRYYFPMSVMTVIYLAMRIHACGLMVANGVIHHVVNPLLIATIPQRIVTPFMLFAKYLWLTFWPAHLSADYSEPSLMPTANVFQPLAAIGLLTVALTVVMSIRQRKKAPQIWLLAGLFFFSYMLIANVIRIGTIFGERLFYFPSIFVLIVIAWALVRVFSYACEQRMKLARPVMILMFIVAVGAMVRRTWVRNTDWTDNLTLALATGRDNPMSAKACSWAGATLACSGRPDFEAYGRQLLQRAVKLVPDFQTPWWELARHYAYRGKTPQSIEYLAHAVRLDPGTHKTCIAIPAVTANLRALPPGTYMPYFEQYLKDHPKEETAYFALALAYHAQKKYALAEQYARKAIDLTQHTRPDGFDQFHEAAAELARVQFKEGKYEQAISEMRKYATFMANSVDAHCEFAKMLMDLDPHKFPDAMKEASVNLLIARTIDPENARVRGLVGRFDRIETRAALARAEKSKIQETVLSGVRP